VKNTRHEVLAAFALAPLLMLAAPGDVAGQSGTAVSPFVSYVPSAAQNPMVGMTLTFGGTTGLAFRAGADLSVETPQKTDSAGEWLGELRPWSADADVMLFLSGIGGGATVYQRALAPYLFAGIGVVGADSVGGRNVHNGWSYGVGASLPLGFHADVFAEARFRMPKYVMPTSKDAPGSRKEFRFGLSFLVGGSDPEPPRRRRHADADDDLEERRVVRKVDTQVVVVQQQVPEPAAPPVVVVQQPAPPPTVVVVQPDPEPRNTVNVNFPIIFGTRTRPRHRDRDVIIVTRPMQRVPDPVWVPTTPVHTTPQRAPAATVSCTTASGDRRSGSSSAKVCVVKP
jgi:hypothetical protein